MNLGTILVHLDHSEHCVDRVRFAASMATEHGSHLVGLVPTGLYDGRIPAEAIATDDTGFRVASTDYLRARAEDVAHAFRNEIRAAGPLSYDVRVVDEPSADAVIRHARCSDLVIVGQGGHADAMTAVDLPAQAVLHAGRPVLVVPRELSSRGPAQKVLVAWDGSREAGMALRDALPLLSRASVVTLVSLHDKGDKAEDTGREALLIPQTIAWLQRHGVQATAQQQAVRGSFADALLSNSARMEVDLVVMGGYGHARLREFVLGGVTHQMLSGTSVPVLMAH